MKARLPLHLGLVSPLPPMIVTTCPSRRRCFLDRRLPEVSRVRLTSPVGKQRPFDSPLDASSPTKNLNSAFGNFPFAVSVAYRITRVARYKASGTILIPNAVVTLRLMTNSMLLFTSTGISPRICPSYYLVHQARCLAPRLVEVRTVTSKSALICIPRSNKHCWNPLPSHRLQNKSRNVEGK
jgi:hypothetical protein